MPTSDNTSISLSYSREAEEALLGSVLINPMIFSETALSADAFYTERHKFVWRAFQSLKDKSRQIDILTVQEELESNGHLDDIGGPSFLASLFNQVPTSLNSDAYADIIRDYHVRRLLLLAANDIALLVYDGGQSVEAIIAKSEESLRRVVEQGSASEKVVDVTVVVAELYDQAFKRAELVRDGKLIISQRVATGLLDVDKFLKGGLRPKALYLIAGRPGQGKSSWMQTLAQAAVKNGKKVGFFSLEMGKEELTARFLSSKSGIDANVITEGVFSDTQWNSFIPALEEFDPEHLFISDNASLTPANLRSQAWQMKSRHGLDLLIVDYIQIMRPGIRSQNREQEVAYISRELKLIALELNIPVLAAAQLSRASENRGEKEPQLSDLRESGSLENDADVVMFIWRPDMESAITKFKVAKHRGGPIGIAELYFDTKLTRFANLAKANK